MSATLEPPAAKKPPLTTPGFHENVPYEEYDQLDAERWSTLKLYSKSAKDGRHKELMADRSTGALDFGRAFHCAILEPELFAKLYVSQPRWQHGANTIIGKAERKDWAETNKEKAALTADEWDELAAMQEAVMAHPLASAILYGTYGPKPGKNELTVVWKGPGEGKLCKCRLDRFTRIPIRLLDASSPNGDQLALVCADIKTTKSAEPAANKFPKDAAEYGYHGQFGYYDDGLQTLRPMPVTFLVIAIEKPNKARSNAIDIVVYQVGDDLLSQGKVLYRRLRDRRDTAISTKKYPGISDQLVQLYLPAWAEESEDEGDE